MKQKYFKHILFSLNIFFIIPLFFIISCKSSQKREKFNIPEPQWVTDKKGAFPDSEYLAQLGTGITPKEAENNSIAQLASYFNTNVKSLIQGDTYTYSADVGQQQSPTITERTIKSSVVTSTDLELFALETTEPYYLQREGKWYCCAYINRKTAWNQYEPLVRDQKNNFYSLFNLAAAQTEPLEKIKAYSRAEPASQDFIACLYRASMFSKEMTDSAFGKDRMLVASIPSLIQKEKNNCVFYVKTSGDFGAVVSSAVNSAFSKLGFTVSDNEAKSYYIVESVINYNEIVQDELIVYYPSVKINVKSRDKTLYVYENKLDKLLSYNESKAKKAACDSIADLITRDLPADFKSSMGLSD
jgi:hypothetical protein